MIVVDGNNVMGTRADGWWRDRPAAVRRLLARLQCYRRTTGDDILLVLDVAQADLPEGDHDGVMVRYARRRGRDAADLRILELLDEREGGQEELAEVVTSDRALAGGARRRNASVTGASTFLARLDAAGC